MDRLADRFSNFAVAYKSSRYKLWDVIGQNNGNGLQRFIAPFRSWDQAHVINTDVDQTKSSLKALRASLQTIEPQDWVELRLISLAAKKRSEIMAAKSDFYPAYSALLGVCLAVLAVFSPNDLLRGMSATGVLAFVAVSAVIRMQTREQVAYLKELALLLDQLIHEGDRAKDSSAAP